MLWKFIAGVALVAASVRTYFYAEPWFRTAGPTAVDEPLSLSPGHVTAKFLAGYNARYRMGIGFAAPQELRFEKPNWLPLPYYPPNDGSGIPTSLKIPWKLSSRGQLIEQGSPDATIWRVSGGEPFLAFGNFHLDGGRRYKLDVDFLNDGNQLALARPRPRVYVFQAEFPESFGLGIKAFLIKLLTRTGYGLSVLIGLALVVSALLRNEQNHSDPKREVG